MKVFETYIYLTDDEIEIIKHCLFNTLEVDCYSDRDDFDTFVETYHKLLEAERRIANDKRAEEAGL